MLVLVGVDDVDVDAHSSSSLSNKKSEVHEKQTRFICCYD
jgi:hypothetical protein